MKFVVTSHQAIRGTAEYHPAKSPKAPPPVSAPRPKPPPDLGRQSWQAPWPKASLTNRRRCLNEHCTVAGPVSWHGYL